MSEATLRGWRINYTDRGEGRPVLLIHGLLMDHTMFDPQTEALASGYRVITPDLRGHGSSEHGVAEYTQWDLMEDHVALLDHLGIEKAVWGGVSQGGFQSLRAALAHPERVEALILIDSQAGPEDPNKAPMYEAFAHVVATQGWTDEILDAATVSMFGDSADHELKEHWKKRWQLQETTDSESVMHAVSRRDDITSRLSEIDAPALVVHGEEDAAIDMVHAETLARSLKNVKEFVKVPGAGHSSTVERPGPITAAIERFLESL